jgi:hypothetical protein
LSRLLETFHPPTARCRTHAVRRRKEIQFPANFFFLFARTNFKWSFLLSTRAIFQFADNFIFDRFTSAHQIALSLLAPLLVIINASSLLLLLINAYYFLLPSLSFNAAHFSLSLAMIKEGERRKKFLKLDPTTELNFSYTQAFFSCITRILISSSSLTFSLISLTLFPDNLFR